MPTMTGGELVVKTLRQEGVTKVFGIIDGTYFGLYSKLSEHGINLITPRHESTAAHMAGAYARLTGELGVCIASNGPGVANVLAALPVENAEGNRILLITSSRRTGITYPDRGGTYQYFNQTKAIAAMSKWSGAVASADRISELLRRALRLCYSGRPGVVHLDIPENIMNSKSSFDEPIQPGFYRHTDPLYPSPDLVELSVDLLKEAEFPIIHAGSGIIHAKAYQELAEVAHLLRAPVCTSWSARGVLPENDPLAWPMVHVKAVNELRNAADVVLCVGSRIGETDWWGKAPYWKHPSKQKLIQVDIDLEILGLNKPADITVPADAKLFLDALARRLKNKVPSELIAKREETITKLTKSKKADRQKLDEKLDDTSAPMITAHVGAVCREIFDDDAVVIFDGGNTAVWGNFYFQLRSVNCQLSTHHFGMLGAGLGQTLGAAVARPDKQVLCIIGDGAFGFHPQEIETAVRNNLKPIFLVCADRQWGMVKINQQMSLRPVKTVIKKSLGPEETINTDLGEIAYDEMARSMGAHGERVSNPDELKMALERSLAAEKCAVIHVDVDPVKHMWAPALLYFKEMHQEPAGK